MIIFTLICFIFFSLNPYFLYCAPNKQIVSVVKSLSDQLCKKLPPSDLSVAVMPFENTEGKVTQLGQLIADGISKELVASKKIKVVERKDLDKIYREWKLNLTGAVNSQSTREIGEMTGASYLLLGSIQKMGANEMLFFSKLVKTDSAEIHQAASVSMKADDETLLLNRPVEKAEESKDDAVILSKKGLRNCVWVESPGVVRFGVNETKNQARARAIVKARQKAMTAILDEETAEEFSNFSEAAFKKENQLIENVLLLTRYGRITEEKIMEENVVDAKDCKACRYRVVLQDCVTPPKENIDKGFQVSLSLSRTEFKEEESAQVIIGATRDSYIYLMSVDKDWNQVTAFPNSLIKENFIKANDIFIYPDESHKKNGVRLVAELPEGAEFSAETLRALATKQPIPESLLNEKYNLLLEKLSESNIDWCESASAFTIRKR